MKRKLISALETLGFPVMLQGSLNPEESYPDSFITFWCDETEGDAHFDNETHSFIWYFSVIFYSANPTLVNAVPNDIRAVLKSAGFVVEGKGQDILSDEQSHTGWALDCFCTENEKKFN